MNKQDLYDLRWELYVWRGALGGGIGTLVVVLAGEVYNWLRFGTGSLGDVFVIAGLFGLISGPVTGLAIGFVIFKVTRRSGKQPNNTLRFAIGAGCVFAYILLTNLTKSGPILLTFDLGYAVAVGGLAGLMARAKNTSASIRVSATSA